jgi:diaminopimelate epimerase
MTKTAFTKMHGNGNDFILMTHEEFVKIKDKFPEAAEFLCDRRFGIGADGIFIPDPNPKTKTDTGWYFFQSDGSTAQMCGNGMRCFAKFVYDRKIVNKKVFSVETLAGTIIPEIMDDGRVRVNMSRPVLESAKIPFTGGKILNYPLQGFSVNAISMGNPHCVIFTDKDINGLAKKYGAALETDPHFPEKTNVEFVQIVSENQINLAVWERGCGITLACGTGACAGVVAAVLNGYCGEKVKVNLPGGILTIEWAGNSQNTDFDVFMTGDAVYVYDGVIDL